MRPFFVAMALAPAAWAYVTAFQVGHKCRLGSEKQVTTLLTGSEVFPCNMAFEIVVKLCIVGIFLTLVGAAIWLAHRRA